MSTVAKAVTRLISEHVYELPLAKDYCKRWGLPEAVREVVQNAIDSQSPFEYELDEQAGRLRVTSRHSTLEPRTLLLGTTSKADDKDAIGSFGEGYKIAMLVLARGGYGVTIHNGDVEWRPEFRFSRRYGAEILCIVETAAPARSEGLTFEIEGLGQGDGQRVRATCLQMQPDVGQVIEVPQGRILLERPGKLYVGGLYVCETTLKHGYDAKPAEIRLERDRQTVSSFDLAWLAKDMWFASGRWDEVARMIEAGVPDLEYAQHGTHELVKEACYRLFVEIHPGKVAARNQAELDAMVKEGLQRVVIVREGFHSIVSGYPHYTQRYASARVKSPAELLTAWLEAHKFHIHHDAKRDMLELIERASAWRQT